MLWRQITSGEAAAGKQKCGPNQAARVKKGVVWAWM